MLYNVLYWVTSMSAYTPEEIKALVSAPMTVGLAVAMVDMGIISTAVEAAAMSKEIAGAAKKYPTNSIIQAAFSDEALKTTKLENPDIKGEDVETGAFVDQALEKVDEALKVLQDKASEAEIKEYKQFIYDCGDVVANAAGSGLFGRGEKVSEKEAATLTRLKEHLGL